MCYYKNSFEKFEENTTDIAVIPPGAEVQNSKETQGATWMCFADAMVLLPNSEVKKSSGKHVYISACDADLVSAATVIPPMKEAFEEIARVRLKIHDVFGRNLFLLAVN